MKCNANINISQFNFYLQQFCVLCTALLVQTVQWHYCNVTDQSVTITELHEAETLQKRQEPLCKTDPSTGPFELLCGHSLIDSKGTGIVSYYESCWSITNHVGCLLSQSINQSILNYPTTHLHMDSLHLPTEPH
jgi:hypothetical protein